MSAIAKRVFLTTLSALLFGTADFAQAAASAFLQVPGISGESTERNHVNWIELLSFGFSATHEVCSGVTVTKYYDSASHLLAAAVVNGDVFPLVVLDITSTAGRTPGLTFSSWKLTNATATSVSQSLEAGGTLLTEQLVFHPTSIEMTFKPMKPDGSLGDELTTTFDCRAAVVAPIHGGDSSDEHAKPRRTDKDQ